MANPEGYKFEKPGPGRPKGMQNKATTELKDMILGALSDVGGRAYLAQQAIDNPGPFMTLVGKCLPKDINASVKGSVVITATPLDMDI